MQEVPKIKPRPQPSSASYVVHSILVTLDSTSGALISFDGKSLAA